MGEYYRQNTVGEMRHNDQSFAEIVEELKEKGYSSRQILWKIEDHAIDAEVGEIGRHANMILQQDRSSYKDQFMDVSMLLAQQAERWGEVEGHLWFEEKVAYQIYQSLQHHHYSSQEIKIIMTEMGFQLDAIPGKPKEPYEVEFPYWFPDGYFALEVFYDAYRKNVDQLITEWVSKLLPLLHNDGKKILKETFDHPFIVLTEDGSSEEHWYQPQA